MQRAITLANSLVGVDNLSIEDYDGWHLHHLSSSEASCLRTASNQRHLAFRFGKFRNNRSFPLRDFKPYTDATQLGKSNHVLRLGLRIHRITSPYD